MLTTLIALAALTGSQPIRLEPVSGHWIVRAVDAGEANLAITLDSTDESLPAVLGTQTTEGRDRLFTPRFPFQPGLRYRAVVVGRPAFSFEIPATPRAATPARVTHVYPTASVLPENQLKFYVEFATPMTRGEAYRRIRLLDGEGRTLELPFLVLDEELWDARMQRFTLYFDPGRVKSDLVPNREAGSPLRAGQRYTLVVDAGWKDANGVATVSEFRKAFMVGARDEASPEPRGWRIRSPAASSIEPLAIEFAEPLEHALALRMIELRDRDDRVVEGVAALSHEESRWTFTPEQTWTPGRYSLHVDATLEDLAGNKVSRPFEVAIRSEAERKAAPTSVIIAFEVR